MYIAAQFPFFLYLAQDMADSQLQLLFEECYTLNYHKVRYFAQSYLHDAELATDIAQEVFVSLWEGREAVDFCRNVLPLLITMTRNRCLNHIKRQQVQQRYQQHSLNALLDDLNARALQDLPVQKLYSDEVSGLIDKSLREMPPRVRDTFVLCKVEGFKYREIAEKEEVTIKAIEQRISVALRVLRKNLKDYLHFVLWFLGPWL